MAKFRMAKLKKRIETRETAGDYILRSSTATIIFGVITLALAVLFILMPRATVPVTLEDTEVYTGAFDHYAFTYAKNTEYMDLYFTDDSMYSVHHTCVTDVFKKQIESLEKGETLTVRVNPAHGYIVEIKTDSNEYLPFEDTQKRIHDEAIWFMWLGVVVAVMAVFLIGYGIYNHFHAKKAKQRKKQHRHTR